MSTPIVNPISVASFRSDTFNFDPLVADETISQSAKIAASLGVLKRGTVLYGPAPGVALTTATNLTTVPTGLQARVLLAQDIDTGTGAAVTGLVYTAGKFMDTGIIFGSQGAALDAAQLWQFNVHVLTVLARNGQLIPMISLPATGGVVPQMADLLPDVPGVTISPTSATVAATGGAGTITVTITSPGTSGTWTVDKEATATWLTYAPTTPQPANGSVTYTAAANTGASRVAHFYINGKTFTLTQSAAA